jgi:hypothetical protein
VFILKTIFKEFLKMTLSEDDKKEIKNVIIMAELEKESLSNLYKSLNKENTHTVSLTSFIAGCIFTLVILGIWQVIT